MAFIHDNDLTVLNIRLTDKGREQLAKGRLNFSKFAVGDSEIDYRLIKLKKDYYGELENLSLRVLRPIDLNPEITSFIKKNENSDVRVEINGIPSDRTIVNNDTEEIGCFNRIDDQTVEIKDGNINVGEALVDFKIGEVQILTINGLDVTISEQGIINVGDVLLLKDDQNIVSTSPKPYLFFYVTRVEGNVVTLDRKISNNYLDYNFVVFRKIGDHYPVDYLFDTNVTALLGNFDYCNINLFPYWKMSIIMLHNIPGVNGYPDNEEGPDKSFLEYETTEMGGFVNYIQKEKEKREMLGVIHYSNPSPSNIYAEGLYETTPIIHIPTIMWEKGSGEEMGLKLYCCGEKQQLNDITNPLNISYYDLYDGEKEPINIVGKVFNGLKLIIIEDQDLIMSMNYKANRSWTLPEPVIFESGSGSITPTTTTEEASTTTSTEAPTTTTTTQEQTTE